VARAELRRFDFYRELGYHIASGKRRRTSYLIEGAVGQDFFERLS